MRLISLFICTIAMNLFAKPSFAKSGFGLNVGAGFPFLMQGGINYRMSDTLPLLVLAIFSRARVLSLR